MRSVRKAALGLKIATYVVTISANYVLTSSPVLNAWKMPGCRAESVNAHIGITLMLRRAHVCIATRHVACVQMILRFPVPSVPRNTTCSWGPVSAVHFVQLGLKVIVIVAKRRVALSAT